MTTKPFDKVPEVADEDKDGIIFVPPQSRPPAPLDDGPGPLVTTQIDTQPDIQGQLDSHPLLTTGSTEASEPTSDYPIPQPHIGEVATSPNEIEEVTSTGEQ